MIKNFAWKATKSYWKILFWLSYRLKSSYLHYPPLVVNIEPTNHCNLRCPFCPVSQASINPGVERGHMSAEVFELILTKIAPYRPAVAINMGGESTLHKQLPDMIKRLADAGCYVFLDTNATALTMEISESLCKSGLAEIVFCIDGEGDETSYQSMRVGASFEKTVANVRRFIRMTRANRAKHPFPSTVVKNIRYYRPDVPLKVAPGVRQLFSDEPPDAFLATWADYWPGSHAENLESNYQVLEYSRDYRACSNLWKKMAITWDGKVSICCLDLNRTIFVGDLNTQSLTEIWNGIDLQKLRTQHRLGLQAKLELCQSCTMIRRSPRSKLAGLLSLRKERFTPFSEE